MDKLVLGVVVSFFFVVTVSVFKRYYPNYKDDNVVEEMAEQVIEQEIGVSIDITPFSPETDKKLITESTLLVTKT